MGIIRQYTKWLHTRWPAGRVEKLPVVNDDGSTNVPGLFVVGDLTGVPLLKFSAHTGARAVKTILNNSAFAKRDTSDGEVLDLAIIGGGVSGFAAALEAKHRNLRFELFEASEPYSTIVNFPKGKPIFTYPTDMTPDGDLQFHEKSAIKEGLIDDLHEQTLALGIEPTVARVESVRRTGGLLELQFAGGETQRAHRVIVGIGRSGNFRKLGVPGEELDKVYNRLHDPQDFCGKDVVVVGGGDSALETAIALASCGCMVTLSYRKPEFSRPKPENVERLEALIADPSAQVDIEGPSSDRVTTAVGAFIDHRSHAKGSIRLALPSTISEIREGTVVLKLEDGTEETIPNEAVFSMIGREAPLDFFRRSGVRISGEWSPRSVVGFGLFFAFCFFLYHWKSDAGFDLKGVFKERSLFPFNLADPDHPANLFGTLRLSMQTPSFYYTLAYTTAIIGFGIRRVRRRKTPYVKVQTTTLAAIQILPLFLLPYVLLPWIGHNGGFESGLSKSVADSLFPLTDWDVHGREYWRSVGFILAWPLMIWNIFTNEPLWAWLIIGFLQTFVLLPILIRKYGKGVYCGWICSCGALAETMGDAHRTKMPHGPGWNRFNMLGQVFLFIAVVLLVLRIVGWIVPDSSALAKYADTAYMAGLYGKNLDWQSYGFPWNLLNYVWFVDLLWAGVFGVAFYFWFSGRVWCRFACPLAALMHIYARFTRFRIIADKKKCISCNVCTSVCHQGIDIMNFANKGLPMEDPECVRCSACVQSCPTGVLEFGEIHRKTGEVIRKDKLPASLVHMAEE